MCYRALQLIRENDLAISDWISKSLQHDFTVYHATTAATKA